MKNTMTELRAQCLGCKNVSRSNTTNTFLFSFRVASPLAHVGLSQVQVLRGGGSEAVKQMFHFIS
jgi:hypothetical protein